MQKFRKKLADITGIPHSAVMDIPLVTVQGNINVKIENYKSILLYTDSEIRIMCYDCTVEFEGTRLQIDAINEEFVTISGEFCKIEYKNIKKR